MAGEASTWVVILATDAGQLNSTRRGAGNQRDGEEKGRRRVRNAKLSRVISRAQIVSGRERCVVVAPAAQWAQLESALAPVASDNLFLQPCDRGTACSLLWPLVHIACNDPEATVVVLPADREDVDTVAFARALDAAVELSRRDPGNLVLLAPSAVGCDAGHAAESPLPGRAGSRHELLATDKAKGAEKAREVVESGHMWGGLAFAAQASTLVGIFEWSIPWLVRMFNYWLINPKPELHSRMADHLFRVLPVVDFLERVLPSAAKNSRVVAVPKCLCSDLAAGGVTPRCRFNRAGCGLAATTMSAPTAVPAANHSVEPFEQRHRPRAL